MATISTSVALEPAMQKFADATSPLPPSASGSRPPPVTFPMTRARPIDESPHHENRITGAVGVSTGPEIPSPTPARRA